MTQKYSIDCFNCGGAGTMEGECTCWDDTCCCLEPDPPTCGECGGRGILIVSKLTADNCETAIPID